MNLSRNSKDSLEFAYNTYTGMRTHEVTMTYQGIINHNIIKLFSAMIEDELTGKPEPITVQRRVFHVLIESLQNIIRHAKGSINNEKSHSGRGILMISRSRDKYRITTGNLIENFRVKEVKDYIELINSMDKSQLDEMYKKQILEGQISIRGGAGLGLIDIKRKTGRKLDYQFISMEEDSSFFLFSSTIPRTIKP